MVVYGGWLHMWTVNLPDRIRNERDSSSPSFHSNHLERLAFARVILGATALPGRVFAAQPLYQPLGFEALGLRPRRKLARRATLQFSVITLDSAPGTLLAPRKLLETMSVYDKTNIRKAHSLLQNHDKLALRSLAPLTRSM